MWLDAVLPLTLRDAPRAELLFESLKRNFSGLRRIWVVCPPAHLQEITARYASLALPFELRIESELDIVPEFKLKVRQSGWFRQQMIKLAIHERIDSEFYLTLDADVVCTRPVSTQQLVGTGRAACFLVYPNEYDYWYQRVEDVLRIQRAEHRGLHNVTPALLSRQAVRDLAQHIEQQIQQGHYSRGMRGLKQRWFVLQSRRKPTYVSWRVFLIAARPWTEYALYYSFLEATGRFDQYHFYTPDCLYDVAHSLWAAQAEAQWNPAPAFAGVGPPWFLVAQSNTGISAEVIRSRLQPLLDQRTPEQLA